MWLLNIRFSARSMAPNHDEDMTIKKMQLYFNFIPWSFLLPISTTQIIIIIIKVAKNCIYIEIFT
jgi:hypothetical protein